ncbi:MAG TPA: glycosyltransferase family 1 protein [Patescibacteria group bacterium]|nr:glycosyltransferase family 1 protein [Patescibacteria group bacterium]
MNKNGTLRIGIDGRVLQDAQRSGIPSYAYHIVHEIINNDSLNHYVIFFNSFRRIDYTILKFNQKNVEIKIYHFPNKILEWVWKIFPFPKIDRILNLDVFFSPHFLNIPLSKKVKKIVTIHDLSFEKNKKYFSLKKNLWHWQMNPRRVCKYYDKIIAVSESTKNDLENIYGIKKEKIKVIYNGASFEKEINEHLTNEVFLKYGVQKDKYILFISTLEPRKNIEGIIDAYSLIQKNSDMKLVIAGKKGWAYKKIFKKINKNDLYSKISFTGFINDKEKQILYSNAKCFIYPSFYEGFGIPVLEAKHHFLPTVTSFTSSLPEIVKNSAILVNPHSIYDIAQSIQFIKSNLQLSFILKKKMALIAKNEWDHSGKETLNYILN